MRSCRVLWALRGLRCWLWLLSLAMPNHILIINCGQVFMNKWG
ncbi:hypothetical protein A2U01_0118834, partial [Trifolium medium]|nr:hypothetical protein [Trifolium medium]